jgi:hypothetical protein
MVGLCLAVLMWRAVAEDYAPFNIDVTTIKPSGVWGGYLIEACIGGRGTDLAAGVPDSSEHVRGFLETYDGLTVR